MKILKALKDTWWLFSNTKKDDKMKDAYYKDKADMKYGDRKKKPTPNKIQVIKKIKPKKETK